MPKHRASFSLLSTQFAIRVDLGDDTYVFGHPLFWQRKGVTPDCDISHAATPMANDMMAIFSEFVWPLELPCWRIDAGELIKTSERARKKLEALAGGVMELFGSSS